MANEDRYNDRALEEGSDDALPRPQIEIIVDGTSVFKPTMKTYFVDDYGEGNGAYEGKVMGTYCSCDLVASTHVVCTCESVCTCDSVCTCESVCSCVSYTSCSCQANTGGGQWVSCGSPCACVPVH